MSLFGAIVDVIRRIVGGPLSRDQVDSALAKLASEAGQPLNWRESIVDLLKLVQQPHDLAARKTLAQELGYTGKLNGSAEMNIWLHRQVMDRLADGRTELPR